LTVAKNWAYAGVKTAKQVEEKFAVQEYDSATVAKVLKNLGSKRKAEPDDYQMLEAWRLKGFDDEVLLGIATFCNKTSRRRIEDMNNVIERFFKLGLVTPTGIDAYISKNIAKDKAIRELLQNLGLSRDVANIDRDFYSMWVDTWKFSPEIINYGATLAVDKGSPMAYLNKVLANWFEKKITTLDAAKKSGYCAPTVNITRHSYSANELNSLFANIDELKF
jgi:DnaD/phage-associated family protein